MRALAPEARPCFLADRRLWVLFEGTNFSPVRSDTLYQGPTLSRAVKAQQRSGRHRQVCSFAAIGVLSPHTPDHDDREGNLKQNNLADRFRSVEAIEAGVHLVQP